MKQTKPLHPRLRLLGLVKRAGERGIYRSELNTSVYPQSMVSSLISKGLLTESESTLLSVTDKGLKTLEGVS